MDVWGKNGMKKSIWTGVLGITALLIVAGCNKKQAGQPDLEDWGQHASMVLYNGTPYVAFYHRSHQIDEDREETVGALIFATGSISGDTATFKTSRVDGDVRRDLANVGMYTSLAMGTDGHPRISYYDKTNGDLKYAWHDGNNWSVETVDASGDTGLYTSLALSADNLPRIAYYDASDGELWLAHNDGTEWHKTAVDMGADGADVGKWADLKLDESGNAYIAYYDATNGDLLLTIGNGLSFEGAELVDTADDVGRWPALALQGGDIHITYEDYTNHRLKYAVRRGGGSWEMSIPDQTEWVGADSSLVVDASGNPHIAYFDGYNNDLKYAHFDGSGWLTSAVATEGGNGYFNTLQLDENGRKHFAFYSFADSNLNYVITN